MTLHRYHEKRDFDRTPEPRGEAPRASGAGRFVIQKHAATRLHYDFRLELDGVLKSWAVPKGPSLDPKDRRLAVHVEDHPVEYGTFEGTIPRGEYGGGTVVLWDHGSWQPLDDAAKGYAKGHLRFTLDGEKLHGEFSLVRMHGRGDDKADNWLLIKGDDEHADSDGELLVRDRPESVTTGRTLDEVAAAQDKDGRAKAKPIAKRQTKKTAAKKTTTKKTAAKKTTAQKATAEKTVKKATAKKAVKKTAAKKTATRKAGKKSTSAKKTAKVSRTAKKTAVAKKSSAKKSASAKKSSAAKKPPAEPPPASITPELATLVDAVPTGDNWLHEIKLDGYRLVARIDGDAVQLLTRGQEDWAPRFPWLVQALRRQIRVDSAILDGELVHVDARGITSFGALQQSLASDSHAALAYYAFDLIHLGGVDLRRSPLLARKQALAELLAAGEPSPRIRLSEHIVGNGEQMLRHARELGLEGVISKRADSVYRTGRHHDWLKIKCGHRQEVVVGGFTAARSGPRRIGALLMGVFADDGTFVYCGKVGTGFDAATASDLRDRLDALAVQKPPYLKTPPDAARSHFVRPALVVEVAFTEWTSDGCLRHPVFQGIREDKQARDVRRERAEPTASAEQAPPTKKPAPRRTTIKKPGTVEVLGVPISHPDRVLYPDQNLTKQDLANYYDSISQWILPWVQGRPLSILRCPDGLASDPPKCFFQRHIHNELPPDLHTVALDGDHEPFIYIKNARGLVALTQVGVLEMHAWGATTDHPDEPDRMVLDLDPGPGVPWARIKYTATALRTRLGELGLTSFLKTTGGKGLHLVVPLTRGRQTWDDVKKFSQAIAREFAAAAPALFTATASKAGRTGKIYLDYLRNSRGATAIVPYSARARPGAPVAVPLRWDELAGLAAPDKYTVVNLGRRLSTLKADPWADLPRTRQSLRATLLRKLAA